MPGSTDYEIVSLLNVGNEPLQGSDGQMITAEKLWGQVVTALRARGPQNLYAIASQAVEVYIGAGTLYVKIKEDDYESASSYKAVIYDVLGALEPGIKLMLIKHENTEQTVFVREVAKIRKLLGQKELKLRK